jgi:hypothetical protein
MTKKSVQTISPVAYFRSPFTEKFGIPRQSGLVSDLHGRIVFVEDYREEGDCIKPAGRKPSGVYCYGVHGGDSQKIKY